jgi:hypothetical protein
MTRILTYVEVDLTDFSDKEIIDEYNDRFLSDVSEPDFMNACVRIYNMRSKGIDVTEDINKLILIGANRIV